MTGPEIAPCPEGHEANCVPYYVNGAEGWYVACKVRCWAGPRGLIEALAIAAWNERMGDGWVECGERAPQVGVAVIVEEASGWIGHANVSCTNPVRWVRASTEVDGDEVLRWQPLPKGKVAK